MIDVDVDDLAITTLGPCNLVSPLSRFLEERRRTYHCVDENDGVLFDDLDSSLQARVVEDRKLPAFEPAGPRKKIYFDPSEVRAGSVPCGRLCPGLNDVIRALVLQLTHRYGVTRIYGFCNGFQGFIARHSRPVHDLTPQFVSRINQQGGTILGTSRGQQDPAEIVDCLERMNINMLFVIGGDGTLRGACQIVEEIKRRGEKIAVVGVPKTIDNDIMFINQSFGFQTAVSMASDTIRSAHVEAKSAPNGIGLVKLMGRHCGFIASYASLATGDANFVLIPEESFKLDGENGLLDLLHKRIERKAHAVVVVAEGAGQDLLECPDATDASGNARFADIGKFLKQRIEEHFEHRGTELTIKYFDPSYSIRSVPASPFDAIYCVRLAHNAVHAAMSGRTGMVVGRWHNRFVHVPMPLAVRQRYQVDPNGDLWTTVLESTGQPRHIG